MFEQRVKYKTIYADPPWNESGGGKIKRGADRHYPLMKTKDICALPVNDLADANGCHLYLWATNNFLKDAFAVMEAWGFRYVTMITWLKEGPAGLGQYYRGRTEHCLFGTLNVLPYKVIDGKRAQGLTGFIAPRREHSKKPEEMRNMIERVSYAPRIELFARERFDGWDAWGNEAPQAAAYVKISTIDEGSNNYCTDFDNDNREAWNLAAEWWADRLMKPITDESREQFINHLSNAVCQKLENGSRHVNLSVDFAPVLMLSEAAEKAGISINNFPRDTFMLLSRDYVRVQESYCGDPVYLYANKTYWQNKIRYLREVILPNEHGLSWIAERKTEFENKIKEYEANIVKLGGDCTNE